VRNYERVGTDHVSAQRKTGQNPWIEESLWVEIERATVEVIRKYVVPGQRILDVGVGLGRVLERFPHLDRYGMDISFDYLGVAKKKGIQVSYALIEDMPYFENCFDIVLCTDVLEHVVDLNLACRKILSVLRSDGTLIVRVPYREDLMPYLEGNCQYKYLHFRNFDEHSLGLLFERIFPYRIVEKVFTGYGPGGLKFRREMRAHFCGLMGSKTGVAKAIRNAAKGVLRVMDSVLTFGIRKMLYHPAEIIIVVKKGQHGECATGGVELSAVCEAPWKGEEG
jgi:SAM-dependent methyltransferase